MHSDAPYQYLSGLSDGNCKFMASCFKEFFFFETFGTTKCLWNLQKFSASLCSHLVV